MRMEVKIRVGGWMNEGEREREREKLEIWGLGKILLMVRWGFPLGGRKDRNV